MANFTTDAKLCIERDLEVVQPKQKFDDIKSEFDILETCEWILANQYEKVCLQFPDDLLNVSADIYEEIKSRTNVDLYILGDTSYASCCVDSVAAMHVQSEALIHYGRSCFSKTDIPTFTVLPKQSLDVESFIKVITEKHSTDTQLVLFYDVEFEHCKDDISKHWFTAYPQSYIAFLEFKDSTHKFHGRVLRNSDGNEAPPNVTSQCICVYLGSRGQTLFSYSVSIPAKEWYLLDPSIGTLDLVNETPWFKRRRFLVEKCKDANTVGILVCKLSGEQTKDIISRMKQLCKANGKKSYIVSVGKPNVAKLANFPEIEIYVLIACAENDLYSNRDFYQPIVYPYELEVALNTNRPQYSTTHVTDFDELLPGRRFYCDISEPTDSTDVSLITGKIREIKTDNYEGDSKALVSKQNYALESIGSTLQGRTWAGLEQKLGETEVKVAEEGRKGIALQYCNEPE